ncbi:MAG: lipid IV(A) 3-deoxy-D-manno-octulosonic acid transferase [Pseudomonadales bacterium]|nr:lipid IV(A) 3-deoxy-D-manno-octulosonic acid transferase [Pseudomonadales bacterium]
MYRLAYSLSLYLLLPVVLIRLWWRSLKAPAYRLRWRERFGYCPDYTGSKPLVWIHAVSVGETLAAVPLVHAIQQGYPGYRVIMTTTTPTGSDRVRAVFGDGVEHVYFPYDLPDAVRRFLDRTRPVIAIIMETELWPNTLNACAKRKIPVVLANARLSEKSARGYQRFAFLTRDALQNLSCVAAQNAVDGQRFRRLGLPEEKLSVIGSIKFDLEIAEADRLAAARLKRFWSASGAFNTVRTVWLAASTHPGEDERLLEVYKTLKQRYPALLLVLVPRHPERFQPVFSLCQSQNWRVENYSELDVIKDGVLSGEVDIVIGNTMGELLRFYGAADIAFVGGSLVPVGGHNLVEPAVWALPILAGPHLHNFSDMARSLLRDQAMFVCDSVPMLEEHLFTLLEHPALCEQMGQKALAFAEKNRGSLQRLNELLAPYLANANA